MSTSMTQASVPARDPGDLVGYLRRTLESEAVRKQLADALPRHLPPARLARQAVTLVQTTPGLLKCSAVSVLSGIFKAAELGLELSGPLGQAYLVPRWSKDKGASEATFQVGYRGLIALAYRSGQVKSVQLREVHAEDHFRVRYGTDPAIEHVPDLQASGEAVAYYCAIETVSGAWDFEVLSRARCERHRDQFRSSKGAYSPWDTAFDAMALKTVCRKLGKRFPVSVEFQHAAVLDDYEEQGVPTPSLLGVQAGLEAPPELAGGEVVEGAGSARAEAQAERLEARAEPG